MRSPNDDGMYDTMLATNCKPTKWTDSVIRCTPQTSSAEADYVYTDSSCTLPVLENGQAFPPGSYLSTTTQPPALCGGVLVDHVVGPGAEVSLATTYRKNGPDCVLNTGPNQHYFPIVEIPASTFVEVATNYDATGAVSQMHWDSPDGMGWYRPSGYDTALAAACDYQTEYDMFSATTAICDPRAMSSTGYSDSACAMPLITTTTGCTPPPYARPLSLCSFNNDHRALAVGAAISPNPIYDASCAPGNPDIHSDYYSLSSTPAGNVQTLSRVRDPSGTTRLKPIYLDTAGGVHYQTNIFYDSTLNTECAFGSTNVCGPILTKDTIVLYTDSDCTMQFDAVEVDDDPSSCGTSLAPVPDFATKILGVGQREFHRVGAQHTATVYSSTGTCRRYPELGIPQSWRIFEVDPTVTAATAFEAATVVVDP